MIDTHATNDTIVKMKASVAQLAGYSTELEKVKQLYEEQRRSLVAELTESFNAEVIDKHTLKEMVWTLYWQSPTIQATEIAEMFKLKNAYTVRQVAGPANINKNCNKCGGQLCVTSRTELQSPYAGHCIPCEEKDRLEQKALKEQRLIEEQQKEAEWANVQREYAESIEPPHYNDNETYDAHTLRSMPYKEYLQTKHWKETRYAALRRAAFACQFCNTKSKLHVHHRTYERRGCEIPADLVVLCADCHHHFHHRINKQEEDTA